MHLVLIFPELVNGMVDNSYREHALGANNSPTCQVEWWITRIKDNRKLFLIFLNCFLKYDMSRYGYDLSWVGSWKEIGQTER